MINIGNYGYSAHRLILHVADSRCNCRSTRVQDRGWRTFSKWAVSRQANTRCVVPAGRRSEPAQAYHRPIKAQDSRGTVAAGWCASCKHSGSTDSSRGTLVAGQSAGHLRLPSDTRGAADEGRQLRDTKAHGARMAARTGLSLETRRFIAARRRRANGCGAAEPTDRASMAARASDPRDGRPRRGGARRTETDGAGDGDGLGGLGGGRTGPRAEAARPPRLRHRTSTSASKWTMPLARRQTDTCLLRASEHQTQLDSPKLKWAMSPW
jgi:hypothetical protein